MGPMAYGRSRGGCHRGPLIEPRADLATVPATPANVSDLDEIFGLIDALRTQPGDVGLLCGAQDQYFPDGPVTTSSSSPRASGPPT